jgi:hypothetical protein
MTITKWEIKDGVAKWPLSDKEFEQRRQMVKTGLDYFCVYVDNLTQDLHRQGYSPEDAAGIAYLIAAFPYFDKREITADESQKMIDEIHIIMSDWEKRTRGIRMPNGTWEHNSNVTRKYDVDVKTEKGPTGDPVSSDTPCNEGSED